MKIAFIDVTATVSFGGIQTAIWELSRALHDLGHQVTVVGGEGGIRPDLAGRAISIKTFAFTPRSQVLDLGSRFRRIYERWSLAKHAKEWVDAQAFDCIILTKPFDFFWPKLLGAESKTRFAFMSGGTDFFRGDRWLAKRIDFWLACSHFNAWQIQSRYKRFPRVMYNGVDVEKFRPASRQEDADHRQALRSQLGFSDQDVVFAFAGRLVGWKGMAVAIKSMAEPVLRTSKAKLLIIGDGDQAPDLKCLVKALNLEEKVLFHGAIAHEALPGFYRAVDGGVFPSVGDEAFGITVAEAMASGLPVVGSYVGGIPEVVGNEGSCGLLAAPGSTADLSALMAMLAGSAAERARLGAAARERIVRNYTWTAAAKRMADEISRTL